MKLVYVGPTPEPLELEDGQIAVRGEEVDIGPDLAERLLEQSELDPDAEPVEGEPLKRRPLWVRASTKAAKATKRVAVPGPPETPAERAAAGSPAVTPPDSPEEE